MVGIEALSVTSQVTLGKATTPPFPQLQSVYYTESLRLLPAAKSYDSPEGNHIND